MSRSKNVQIGGVSVALGETRDLRLKVSESYAGDPVTIPVRVIRAKKRGPCVFVTSAVHGNEINGSGIIRELIFRERLELIAGTVVMVPVVNIFGFETQDRYMPDRRDLNRSFPGSENGNLSSQVAHRVFTEIVLPCDYGIDLHTAATQRTNFPNVRGDMTIPAIRKLANAFGCELIVHGKGPEGSLRREACRRGVPTIILEAGEPSKVEPTVLKIGYQGVRNVLIDLRMLKGEMKRPPIQTRVDRTRWIRAEVGGMLRFHVAPGELVEEGQAVASNVSVFGEQQNVLQSPVSGIVLGMTTLPTVKPGEPVCHVAIPRKSFKSLKAALRDGESEGFHVRMREDLATNIVVSRKKKSTRRLSKKN